MAGSEFRSDRFFRTHPNSGRNRDSRDERRRWLGRTWRGPGSVGRKDGREGHASAGVGEAALMAAGGGLSPEGGDACHDAKAKSNGEDRGEE